jgi:hypothetical protein
VNRFFAVLSLVGVCSLPTSWAQLRPANEAGVTVAEVHTIVRDVDAAKKFWVLLGGMSFEVNGSQIIKFPGVMISLTKGEPSGGSSGTPVDHIGFWVSDGPGVVISNSFCFKQLRSFCLSLVA